MKSMPASQRGAGFAGMIALGAGALQLALAEPGGRWQLRATVPALCAVESITRKPDDYRQITIDAQCNLERYAVAFAIGDAPAPVVEARINNGRAVLAAGRVEITARRPGPARIEIVLAETSPEGAISADILPLG